MGVSGQRHAPAVLPPGKKPGTHCTGGWVGPRASLDGCEKLGHHRGSFPDRTALSESLYRLSHPDPRHSIPRVLYVRQCFCSVINGQYKTICPPTAVCHQQTRHHSKTTCSRRVHAERLNQFFAQCHKTEMGLYSPTVKALLIWAGGGGNRTGSN